MKHELHSFYRYFPAGPRDKRWGLYLTTAGESRIPPNAGYPPRGHPGTHDFDWRKGRVLQEYQVVYISAGQGLLEVGRRSWQITPGTVILLYPGVRHRYRPDPAIGWHEHWIGFDGATPRAWVKGGFFSPLKPVLRARREEDLLLNAFNSLIAAIHANHPALQQVMAGLTTYVMSLLFSAQQPGQDTDQNVAIAIREAMRLMNDPVSGDDLDLEKLADSLNVSYTWFRRMFTQHTGLSPHQYRLQLRIARARTLLADTQLSVKEVAFRCGFESEQYFSRLFKQKTTLTATQWRDRATRHD